MMGGTLVGRAESRKALNDDWQVDSDIAISAGPSSPFSPE